MNFIHFIWMVAVAAMYLQIRFTAGELIMLRRSNTMYCITSGDLESSALVWISPLDNLEQTAASTWKYPQDYFLSSDILDVVLNCSLDNESCEGWINRFSLHHVTSNMEIERRVNLGPVEDHRWEKFPTYKTKKGDYQMIQLPNMTQHLHVSILSANNASLFLFDDNEPQRSAAYWFKFDVGGITLRKCLQGVKNNAEMCNEVKTSFHGFPAISEIEWTHFTISVIKIDYNKSNIILRKVNSGSQLLLSWIDSEPLNIKFITFQSHNNKIGYWKLHMYNILQSKEGTTELSSPEFRVSKTQTLCVSMTYHNSGGPAWLRVWRKGNVERSLELKQSGDWQSFRLQTTLIANTDYRLSINFEEQNVVRFLVGDIRVCNQDEIYVSTFRGRHESLDCTQLKQQEIIKYMDVNPYNPAFNCQENYFGEQCDMTCETVLENQHDCRGVVACNGRACSCLAGFMGPDCTARAATKIQCTGGQWNNILQKCLPAGKEDTFFYITIALSSLLGFCAIIILIRIVKSNRVRRCCTKKTEHVESHELQSLRVPNDVDNAPCVEVSFLSGELDGEQTSPNVSGETNGEECVYDDMGDVEL